MARREKIQERREALLNNDMVLWEQVQESIQKQEYKIGHFDYYEEFAA